MECCRADTAAWVISLNLASERNAYLWSSFTVAEKEFDSSFGVYLLTAVQLCPPPLALYLDKLIRKPGSPSVFTSGMFRPCSPRALCTGYPDPSPLTTISTEPLSPPFTWTISQQFGCLSCFHLNYSSAIWVPILRALESSIMWVRNLF